MKKIFSIILFFCLVSAGMGAELGGLFCLAPPGYRSLKNNSWKTHLYNLEKLKQKYPLWIHRKDRSLNIRRLRASLAALSHGDYEKFEQWTQEEQIGIEHGIPIFAQNERLFGIKDLKTHYHPVFEFYEDLWNISEPVKKDGTLKSVYRKQLEKIQALGQNTLWMTAHGAHPNNFGPTQDFHYDCVNGRWGILSMMIDGRMTPSAEWGLLNKHSNDYWDPAAWEPYFVIIDKPPLMKKDNHEVPCSKHLIYLVPSRDDMLFIKTGLKKAVMLAMISKEEAQNALKKLMTYKEFLDAYQKYNKLEYSLRHSKRTTEGFLRFIHDKSISLSSENHPFESVDVAMKRIQNIVDKFRTKHSEMPVLIMLDGIGGKTELGKAINPNLSTQIQPNYYDDNYRNLGLSTLHQEVVVVDGDVLQRFFDIKRENPSITKRSSVVSEKMPYAILWDDTDYFDSQDLNRLPYQSYLWRYISILFYTMYQLHGSQDRIVVFVEPGSHQYFMHMLEKSAPQNTLVIQAWIRKKQFFKDREISTRAFVWSSYHDQQNTAGLDSNPKKRSNRNKEISKNKVTNLKTSN